MALIDDSNLGQDPVFVDRCKMALISIALAVQSESTSATNHAARSSYALKVLANPLGYAQVMAFGFAVDGNTNASSTDAALETRASAIWNAYCVQG
jgi:hypothetical protein